MKRVITSKTSKTGRFVKASYADMSDSAARAAHEVCEALRNLYDVLTDYEDNLEQLLEDPNYYEATMDQIRYLESFTGPSY